MSALPSVAMPTAVLTTAPVSRLPKFTAARPKAALTPTNSNNTTSAANANAKANANANSSAEMGQASTVNNGHSVSSTNSRLSNGFYHHPGQSSGVKSSLIQVNGKQNGFIRAPTNFTAKWRKENVEDGSADFEYKPGKNAKKLANSFTGKTRSLNQNTFSSPKAVPKLANAKVTQKPSLNCLAKKQNGTSSLPKASLRSGSPLEAKKQAAGRSHSSDSLGAAQNNALTTNDKIRSRSLTQVQRQPSPTTNPAAKSRAYSTNRVERKTAGSKASMLPTAMIKKPLVPSYAPKQNGGGNFKIRAGVFKETGPVRVQAEPKRNQRRDSVETPSDNSPGSSPEAPDSRGPLSERGSQNEVSVLGETLEDMSLSSTSSLDHHDTSQEYMDDFDNLGNGGVGILLSSCKNDEDDSGLDRSRFHDDDSGLDRSCSRFHDDGVEKATELCFLDDGLDWNHIRLGADRDHHLRRLSRRRRSSQPDYHSQCGSSLDLSPSDSCGSGGTFLWDEEVEPLGGAVPVQSSVRSNGLVQNGFHQSHTKPDLDRTDSLHVGSLHSDISIDVLNDLESCDLDEDDLMLDVDFPEDGSLTSDGGGSSHMAEWRRRQLCWGTQDVHNDSESDFHADKLSEGQKKQRKDSTLSLDLCLNSLKASPGLGLDVEELVEDCSAVRSQLEYLHKLLLQDDDPDEDTLTTDTLSPESTDSSSDGTETQVEVLLQEVLQLREELRSRDRTIAQLSQQLSVAAVTSRCRCRDTETADGQTQTRDKETESVGSQTPWTDKTPALLQPNPSDQDALMTASEPCSVQSGSTSASVAPPPEPPSSPSSSSPDHVTTAASAAAAAAKDHGKRRGRSLQLPQPSKLRLFMFPGHASSSASTTTTTTTSSSTSSPAPKQKPNADSPGSRIKTFSSASSSSPLFSRLPKPKTH